MGNMQFTEGLGLAIVWPLKAEAAVVGDIE